MNNINIIYKKKRKKERKEFQYYNINKILHNYIIYNLHYQI